MNVHVGDIIKLENNQFVAVSAGRRVGGRFGACFSACGIGSFLKMGHLL